MPLLPLATGDEVFLDWRDGLRLMPPAGRSAAPFYESARNAYNEEARWRHSHFAYGPIQARPPTAHHHAFAHDSRARYRPMNGTKSLPPFSPPRQVVERRSSRFVQAGRRF